MRDYLPASTVSDLARLAENIGHLITALISRCHDQLLEEHRRVGVEVREDIPNPPSLFAAEEVRCDELGGIGDVSKVPIQMTWRVPAAAGPTVTSIACPAVLVGRASSTCPTRGGVHVRGEHNNIRHFGEQVQHPPPLKWVSLEPSVWCDVELLHRPRARNDLEPCLRCP